jgi:hypothetical protein
MVVTIHIVTIWFIAPCNQAGGIEGSEERAAAIFKAEF